jgi:hypothetical protein
VRVGEALFTAAAASEQPTRLPADWRMPLRDALRDNRISSAQFDVIQRGLGDPADEQGAVDAWMRAAEQLAAEAGGRTVEELAVAARTVRDLLDPEGAEARYLARFERRSFRTWTDEYGGRRGSIAFDDEGGLFFESVVAAALRPRRGGPRFVDPDEQVQATQLVDDRRTNDQLAYDLVMDVFRAGVLADAKAVFGTRQAGVRLVRVVDENSVPASVAITEDHLVAVPGAVADRRFCESGTTVVTVDSCGNPLDVGREQRLFTPKQRIALAVRDGGCLWRGCDRPASYCEAHHVDEWAADGGRTDIDRGVPWEGTVRSTV